MAENDITSLQEKLDELEALKQVAIKKLETIGQEQRDIEWLLHWGKEFAGRYNEAKYDDKRDALRILGLAVKVYRVEDTEYPRYEITTSISANIATTSRGNAGWCTLAPHP